MRFFLFATLLLISSCRKTEIRLNPSSAEVTFLFQNGVSLNLLPAGCSLLDLGGAGRMCERVKNENPDLLFQVGPAFSPLVPTEELSTDKKIAVRKALVPIWNQAGVQFYSVDGLDLLPNLKSFEASIEKRAFSLLSTNLRSKEGKALFDLFQVVNWGKQEFVFLGFTSPKKPEESSGWQALSFKQSLQELAPLFKEHAQATLLVLGSLTDSERKELLAELPGPAYFIGGSLNEENSTQWISMGSRSFWGKAVDLGRGMGMVRWSRAAPTGDLVSRFSSKGLRKDLDADNPCSKIVTNAFSSSQ